MRSVQPFDAATMRSVTPVDAATLNEAAYACPTPFHCWARFNPRSESVRRRRLSLLHEVAIMTVLPLNLIPVYPLSVTFWSSF